MPATLDAPAVNASPAPAPTPVNPAPTAQATLQPATASVAPWPTYVSSPEYQEASPEVRRQGFQKWSSVVINQLNNSPGVKSVDRAAILDKIQDTYNQMDNPGLAATAVNAVKNIPAGLAQAAGSLAITGPAVVHDLLAGAGNVGAGNDINTGQTIVPLLGANAAQYVQGAKTNAQRLLNLIPGKTAGGAGIGDILSNLGVIPETNQNQADTDAIFNSLPNRIRNGLPLTDDALKNWSNSVFHAAAKANDEPISDYTGPERDPTQGETKQLVEAYATTHDPVYLNALKARMTSSGLSEAASDMKQQILENSGLPKWAQPALESAGDPEQAAFNALLVGTLGASGPETGAIDAAQATARAPVSQVLGRIIKAAPVGGAVMGAQGVAQEAITNPNATPQQLEAAGLNGLATGVAFSGLHALFTPATWQIQPPKGATTGLTPQAAAGLDKTLGVKVDAGATPGQVATAVSEQKADLTPQQQAVADVFEQHLSEAERLRQSPQGLALLNQQLGVDQSAGQRSAAFDAANAGRQATPQQQVAIETPPGPLLPEPIPQPKSSFIPEAAPQLPSPAVSANLQRQIRQLPSVDFSDAEKAELSNLANTDIDAFQQRFAQMSQTKAENPAPSSAQQTSAATPSLSSLPVGPRAVPKASISDILGTQQTTQAATAAVEAGKKATSGSPSLQIPVSAPAAAIPVGNPQPASPLAGLSVADVGQVPELGKASVAQKAAIQTQHAVTGGEAKTPLANPPIEAKVAGNEPEDAFDAPARTGGSLESAPADIRGGSEAVAQRTGNQSSARSGESAALQQWADQNNLSGRVIPPEETEFSGGEHDVWIDPQTNRYFKVTRPGDFGNNASGKGIASPADYLERLDLQNKLFGDDVRVESVNGSSKDTQIVTSQPKIVGHPASIADIDDYMASKGFKKTAPFTYEGNGVIIGDAKPKNVFQDTSGAIRPIDLQIQKQPTTKGGENNAVSIQSPSREVLGNESTGQSGNVELSGVGEGNAQSKGTSTIRQGAQGAPVAQSQVKDPLDLLHTEQQVKLRAPKGASFVRVTPEEGNPKILPVSEFTGDNVLRGAGPYEKIEAGTKAVGGKFTPMKGDVDIQPVQPKVRGVISGTPLEGWADKTIAASKGKLTSGIDPELMAAYVVKGASLVENGVRDFKDWSKQMLDEYGDKIKPHLQDIFNQANGNLRRPAFTNLRDSIAGAVQSAGDALRLERNRIANYWRSGDVRDALSASRDASDNLADRQATMVSNDIRGQLRRAFPDEYSTKAVIGRELTKSPVRPEDALSFVVEANGKPGELLNFEKKIQDSTEASPKWKARALDAIDFAKKNYITLAGIAKDYNAIHDDELAQERGIGQNTPYRQGYVFHAQDVEDPDGFAAIMRGGGDSTKFKAMRVYPTFADSIANGTDPKSLNSVDLMKARIQLGQRAITKKAWLTGLESITDPTNGQPVVTKVETVTRPNGSTYQIAPQGYMTSMVGYEPIAVQKGYAGLFDALSKPTATGQEAILPLLQRANAFGKSVALAMDTFHLARLGAWESVIKAAGTSADNIKAPIPSYKFGKLLMDTSDKEIQRMADAGEIPRKWLPQVKEAKDKIDALVRNGLNAGSIADNMHQEIVKSIPVLGKFNKFVFEQFQRGAMTEIGLLEYDRQKGMHPDWTQDQVARAAAKDINTRFGSLGRQGLIKSQTGRDIARLAILAPQWNEGLIRSELGGALQAGKGIYDLATKGKFTSGLLGRSLIAMTLAQFAANQTVNLYTRGHPTWDNKEEGINAKTSAFIPDVVGGGSGFFLPSIGLSAEITHLLTKKMQGNDNLPRAMESYLRARASTISRPLLDVLTQQNSYLEGIRPENILSQAAKDAVPLPIGTPAALAAAKQIATGKHSEDYTGEYQRQLMQTFGLRVDSAPGQEQRIGALAHTFNKSKGIQPSAQFFAGDYQPLSDALKVKNEANAQQAISDLLQKKTPEQIAQHYTTMPLAPFTGQRAREGEFFGSLTPEQKVAYAQALTAKQATAQTAMNLLAKQPGVSPAIQQQAENFAQILDTKDALSKQAEAAKAMSDSVKSVAKQWLDAAPQDRSGIINNAIKSGKLPAQGTPEFQPAIEELKRQITQPEIPEQDKLLQRLSINNGDRAEQMLKILNRLPPQQAALQRAEWLQSKILVPRVSVQMAHLQEAAQPTTSGSGVPSGVQPTP